MLSTGWRASHPIAVSNPAQPYLWALPTQLPSQWRGLQLRNEPEAANTNTASEQKNFRNALHLSR
jgi:hypothetical protein